MLIYLLQKTYTETPISPQLVTLKIKFAINHVKNEQAIRIIGLKLDHIAP